MSAIEQRALKNTGVGMVSFLISVFQTIILVPLLLKYWGNVSYGLWLSLMAGFNLLQTLDLGHQNYVGHKLNMQYHTDIPGFRQTLGSSLLIAYILGFFEVGCCVALILTKHLDSLLGISSQLVPYSHISLGLLSMMIMWLLFGSVGGIIARIMIPAGMLYESQWLGVGVRFAQFCSVVVVALTGGGVFASCLWYAVVQSIVSVGVLWYIKVKLPNLYPWWDSARWGDGIRNLKNSLILTLNSIGQQLAGSGLVLLISTLFTAVVLPSFTTIRTITNTASSITSLFISAVFPDMIRFHSTGQYRKLSEIFNVNWFVSGICVNIGLLLILPFVASIYAIWTKRILEFDSALFLLLAVSVSYANFGGALNLYFQGINDLYAQTTVTLARIAVLFLVTSLFSSQFGILSVGLGCLVSEVVASVLLPLLFVKRRFRGEGVVLDIVPLTYAILPPAILTCVAAIMMFRPVNATYISLWLLPVFALIYLLAWRRLDPEIRLKINSMVYALSSKFPLMRL